ncbi:MAG: hypothetical protein ACI4LO_00965 [Anaerovoracaceae bacterium]
MKQYMVLAAMIVLGIYIFNTVAGPDDDSINSSLKYMWQQGLEIRTYTP